ncbi:hypothetical protein ACTFIR_004777 [Dictyostelium discoideum]
MKINLNLFFIVVLLLLLTTNSNFINGEKDNENNENNDNNNNNNNNDNNNNNNENTFVIANAGDLDPETLEKIKNSLFQIKHHRVIRAEPKEEHDSNDDDDVDDDSEEIKTNKKRKKVNNLELRDQFIIQGSNIVKEKPPTSSTKRSDLDDNSNNNHHHLYHGYYDENEEDHSFLFDFTNSNVRPDRELPGRDLLIEAQRYRGYLLYDKLTSPTHPFSNSIMIHGFDLSTDRDLFEFRGQSKLTPLDSTKAYQLLLDSANQGNHRAMYLLGVMNEIGENSDNGNMDFVLAEEWYLKSAEYGNSDAQRSLGFLYATGKLGYIDEAKAILYYSFAARSGNIVAQLTMAYRYLHGYGVEKSCKKSSILYDKVAARVVSDYEMRGFGYQVNSQRFSEERKRTHGYQEESDIVDYLKYSSDDPVTMGRLYLEGNLVQQDFQLAFDYFKRASSMGLAGGYSGLGFMYNMGYGVTQSNKTAFDYYVKASDLGDRDAKSNLAELYFFGYGVNQNTHKAIDIWMENSQYTVETHNPHASFKKGGSGKETIVQTLYHAPSNAHLGRVFAYHGTNGQGQGIDRSKAIHYFSHAISAGDIGSFYHFSKIHLDKDPSSCPYVVQYMKKIAEKGAWAIILTKAQDLYEEDDTDRALLLSEKAAEMGIEMAQFNSAWMYDKRLGLSSYYKSLEEQEDNSDKGRIEDEIVDLIIGEDNTNDNSNNKDDEEKEEEEENDDQPINKLFNKDFWDQQAFRYYDYSAEQFNPLSRIKIGDFFYYGIGVEKSFELAAESYKQAAAVSQPMALFNLGYLYQYGEGVPQDFFLAKRYYDLSLTHQPKGYIPVYLSLISLFFHFIYTFICSLFDPSIKISSTSQIDPKIISQQTTKLNSDKTTTTTAAGFDNDFGVGGILNNFSFDNELIHQLESYTMILFAIIIGFLVIRRQRIILNQQRHPIRQQPQQEQQQQQQQQQEQQQ